MARATTPHHLSARMMLSANQRKVVLFYLAGCLNGPLGVILAELEEYKADLSGKSVPSKSGLLKADILPGCLVSLVDEFATVGTCSLDSYWTCSSPVLLQIPIFVFGSIIPYHSQPTVRYFPKVTDTSN